MVAIRAFLTSSGFALVNGVMISGHPNNARHVFIDL